MDTLGLPRTLFQDLEAAKAGDPELNDRTRRDERVANVVAYATHAAYNVALYDYRRLQQTPDQLSRAVFGKISLGNFGIVNSMAKAAATEFDGA